MPEKWFEIPWRDRNLNKYILYPFMFEKESGADRVTSSIHVEKEGDYFKTMTFSLSYSLLIENGYKIESLYKDSCCPLYQGFFIDYLFKNGIESTHRVIFNDWDSVFINKKGLVNYPRDTSIIQEHNRFVEKIILKELYYLEYSQNYVSMAELLQHTNYNYDIRRKVFDRLVEKGWIKNPKGNLMMSTEARGFVENNLLGSLNSEKQDENVAESIENDQFDVFLSFADEQRDYVEEVARLLKGKDVKYFYDKDNEVEMWGKNLNEYFDTLIRKKSRFLVMFISKEYKDKMWTTAERRSAISRAMYEKREYILPCRFDDTDIEGLDPGAKWEDLREKKPGELAELIIKKVNSL